MSPASKRLRVGGAGEESSSPVRRAVPERLRPISQHFTLDFGGPRALDAFLECWNALSPCSMRVLQAGSHTKIAFDEIPDKRRNSAMKGKR